ncbi:MAG TPA: PadR family transcriptional regulator [Gemmatimonadales bacterium]|nr:PadR family transcriptional regulator [Gemmatimonadales bacterium]
MPERLSAPVYNVLLALGTETRHGYAIMQHLAELTAGAEELLPGTLYATLARMLDAGLIEEARPPRGEESGGPPRRHYRLTPGGRAQAQAETERMRRWVSVARRVWQPGLAR